MQLQRAMSYVCEHCNKTFDNFFSLRAHQNGNRVGGLARCQRRTDSAAGGDSNASDDSSAEAEFLAPVITNPFDIKHEICRRHQADSVLGGPHPLSDLGSASLLSYTGSINYGEIVSAFKACCKWILRSRSAEFWAFYLKTRHLATEDQAEILQLVLRIYHVDAKPGSWCPNKRAVRNLLDKKPFWPLVTYTYSCDLSSFQVPGLGRVKYSFLDPIFAWITQARKLCKNYDLIFRYREALMRGTRTWGSCVSCGEAMRQVKL